MALGCSAFDGNVSTEWFVRSDSIACILKEVFDLREKEELPGRGERFYFGRFSFV